MQSRKALEEKYTNPGGKSAVVNKALRKFVVFEVLLDIRELLQRLVKEE